MQSSDGSITLKSIYYPYYYAIFNTVPHNPFSVMLFSYLGEISPLLYKNNLEKFKDHLNKIKSNDDTKNLSFFKENIMANYNIKSESWSKNLIEDIQSENSSNISIYYILSIYFNLSYIGFNSKEELFLNNKSNFYYNYSSREVYFLLNKEKIPFNILKQDTNGNIRVHSMRL